MTTSSPRGFATKRQPGAWIRRGVTFARTQRPRASAYGWPFYARVSAVVSPGVLASVW